MKAPKKPNYNYYFSFSKGGFFCKTCDKEMVDDYKDEKGITWMKPCCKTKHTK